VSHLTDLLQPPDDALLRRWHLGFDTLLLTRRADGWNACLTELLAVWDEAVRGPLRARKNLTALREAAARETWLTHLRRDMITLAAALCTGQAVQVLGMSAQVQRHLQRDDHRAHWEAWSTPLATTLARADTFTAPLAADRVFSVEGVQALAALAHWQACTGRLADAAATCREGFVTLQQAALYPEPLEPATERSAFTTQRLAAARSWRQREGGSRMRAHVVDTLHHAGLTASRTHADTLRRNVEAWVEELREACQEATTQGLRLGAESVPPGPGCLINLSNHPSGA
jgi:hypothetical protein